MCVCVCVCVWGGGEGGGGGLMEGKKDEEVSIETCQNNPLVLTPTPPSPPPANHP